MSLFKKHALFGLFFLSLTNAIMAQSPYCLSENDFVEEGQKIPSPGRNFGVEKLCAGFQIAVLDGSKPVEVTFQKAVGIGNILISFKPLMGPGDYNKDEFIQIFESKQSTGETFEIGSYPRGTILMIQASYQSYQSGTTAMFTGPNLEAPFLSNRFTFLWGRHTFLGGVATKKTPGHLLLTHESQSGSDFNDLIMTISNVGMATTGDCPSGITCLKQSPAPYPGIPPGRYDCMPTKISLSTQAFKAGELITTGTGNEKIFYSLNDGSTKEYKPSTGILLDQNRLRNEIKAWSETPGNSDLIQSRVVTFVYEIFNALPPPVASPGVKNGASTQPGSFDVTLEIPGPIPAEVVFLFTSDTTNVREKVKTMPTGAVPDGSSINITQPGFLVAYSRDVRVDGFKPSPISIYEFKIDPTQNILMQLLTQENCLNAPTFKANGKKIKQTGSKQW